MSAPLILGLESSCDETAVALVAENGEVLVNAVASQVDLHARFGGVVPEVASRRHLEAFLPLIESAFAEAGVGWDRVESIAVTSAPGLIGCLLVGVETAKALAWRRGLPLRAVHHLQAHLHAPFLTPAPRDGRPGAPAAHLLIADGEERRALPARGAATEADPSVVVARPGFPHVGLIVSGGHTSLALVEAPGRCRTLATTRDDAVGEAYDKVARVLGVGFPGGPVIDRMAAEGDPSRFEFTPPMDRRDERDFSFSGLKSAVARKVEELRRATPSAPGADAAPLDERTLRDLCAGFQSAAIRSLLRKSLDAAREAGVRDLLVVGGVAANRGLRRAAAEAAPRGLRLWFPNFSLCTDNAAMIAGLAWHVAPLSSEAALGLEPRPTLALEAPAA